MRSYLACCVFVAACTSASSPTGDQSGLAGDGKADGAAPSGGLTSGTYTWMCHNAGTPDNSNFQISLKHRGKTILDETIATYHVIENGAQRADSDIGHEVFDVKPSAITFLDSQELKFSLGLQDYSDIQHWLVYLQADPAGENGAYFGVMMSTFQSSDGDDLLHPYSVALACTVTKK